MGKILMTSSGFDALEVKNKLLSWIEKPMASCQVLFIPVAALKTQNHGYIEACKQEILDLGVLVENIHTHTLETTPTMEAFGAFDFIYVGGGNTEFLAEAMKKCDFQAFFKAYVAQAHGIYVGVSAGSLVLTSTRETYLKLYDFSMAVHQESHDLKKTVLNEKKTQVALSDAQALVCEAGDFFIIGTGG